MASPLLELAGHQSEIKIRILPGVTAALSGAALLGAPLGHDFAVISRSDRLTSWTEIQKRLKLTAEAGMPLVLYNPGSHGRKDSLKKACHVLLSVLPDHTPCGMVRNIGREGESFELLTLGELAEKEADMATTVFIGDHTTQVMGGYLLTPRGYFQKL